MRHFPLFFLMLFGAVWAGEPQGKSAFPLWDGHESVADYAKRVNLPPTKSLDLGDGIKLELVLIPAGKFIMGTPEPVPVDEDGFRKKIMTGQALLAVSGIVLLALLAVVVISAIRKRQRPKYSLLLFLAMTVVAGGCVLSGLHWRQSANGLGKARVEYAAELTRYNSANSEEKPGHPVLLTRPFFMGKFTVTQDQYQAVTSVNPSNFKGNDKPVEQVSWVEAQPFCNKLSEITHQAARLPSEAEWEFACRAGTTTVYYSGDTEADLARAAWNYANSNITTHPVGQKEPNIFGLFDMHGNVWQWCEDFFSADYYGRAEAENPQGPTQGNCRVLRGGSWCDNSVGCRSAYRVGYGSDGRYFVTGGLGFRVVVVPESKTP